MTKFLNLCLAQKTVPETVREHYKVLSAHAGDCVECGLCQERCPFGVKITERMELAAKLFA